MSLALYPSRVRSSDLLGRVPSCNALVDAYPAPHLAFRYFDLAPARIVILLANSLRPVARLEVIISFGIKEAFTFALCAVCAALTAI
jgi:hypothetical protein